MAAPEFIPRIDTQEEDVAFRIAEPPRMNVREMESLSSMDGGKTGIPTAIRLEDGKEVDISILLQAIVPPEVLEQERLWSAENTLPSDKELAGLGSLA
ncbi:hypothetical protein J8273_8100 [Carpediemonas membranifera]|uniref:Uncharacterized protein n=1 Tax=Carpediemonas membranifera TaxID=201153 RepID=A0A8J6AWI7_9EUKA|nr:hypothetical protein J8273_8100 [Carpediemonas membranifera]|eukprot:KAG9390063.1 hypothetical protein J8273_8100 [Carpediemonas membranifera]